MGPYGRRQFRSPTPVYWAQKQTGHHCNGCIFSVAYTGQKPAS